MDDVSRSWEGGSTTAWRKLRAQILAANQHTNRGLCQLNVGEYCGRHHKPCRGVCTGRATEVHHLRGKREGDDPRFLVAACAACNRHVGDPTATSPAPTPRSRW